MMCREDGLCQRTECRYHCGTGAPRWWERPSCALVIAEVPRSQYDVAAYLGITRQAVDWIERRALARARKRVRL